MVLLEGLRVTIVHFQMGRRTVITRFLLAIALTVYPLQDTDLCLSLPPFAWPPDSMSFGPVDSLIGNESLMCSLSIIEVYFGFTVVQYGK